MSARVTGVAVGVLAAVITAWSPAVARADDPSPKQVYEKAAPATVHVIGKYGSGTGFVYDADKGRIVTNAHVIQGEAALKVVIGDQPPTPVRVLGSDPCEDLAVLEFTSPQEDLKELEFGKSADVGTADTVIALGYPTSLGNTDATQDLAFTSGAVQTPEVGSTPLTSLPNYPSLIQHSATVNPGSSGGPLLNAKGEVVGINTLGYSEEGVSGQFYAISSDHAEPHLAGLAAGDTKNDPGWWLFDLSDPSLAATFEGIGAPDDKAFTAFQKQGIDGVMALSVTPQSPAAKGNLEAGDVLTSVKGEPVTSVAEVCDVLQSSPAHEKLPVEGVYSGVLDSTGGKAGEAWTAELLLGGTS
ncbi:S1C family serine protease [Streptomyces sp. NPDC088762]|uniref:S1C family serine protease n=1 Tax=Streptomyces sp. NPDC088762 TaxID=3365891 RepID=UPI00382B6F83